MKALVIVGFTLSIVSPCVAQTVTDAPATVSKILAAFGPVPWTHTVRHWKECPQRDDSGRIHFAPCYSDNSQTDTNLLTATNIRIVGGDQLTFDPPTKIEFPSQLISSSTAWANCSTSKKPTDTETLSVSFQRSSSIAISDTISHAQSEKLGVSYTIYGVKIDGEIQVTDTSTSGIIDTKSYQQTIQRTHTISASMDPKTALGATITTWPIQYTATFHSTSTTIDADLSPNNKGYHHLSDIAPASARTFPITGTLGFTDAAGGQFITYDLQYDFSQCPTGAGIIPIQFDLVMVPAGQKR